MRYLNKKENDLSLSLFLVLSLIFILVFILPLVACPLLGQVVQKKKLKISDYNLVGSLEFENVSSDGRWASFTMLYNDDNDTLFVQNTTNKKKYYFPSGIKGQFLKNNRFICETPDGIRLLNLDTSKEKKITTPAQYSYLQASNQLVLLNLQRQLVILDKENNILKKIEGVTYFSVSPTEKNIVYITNKNGYNSIGILELERSNETKWISEKTLSDFTMISWEKTGKALAFLRNKVGDKQKCLLVYYLLENNVTYEMDPDKQSSFPIDKTIDNSGSYAITISDDLSKVFFAIVPKENLKKEKTDNSAIVELWNTNDKWIYPMETIMGQFNTHPLLAVWRPLLKEFRSISSIELPKVMLAGKQQYAILSNPQSYEPQFDYDGPRDFYIMDLESGKTELFLEKQATTPVEGVPICSPDGRYVTYYKENNWWVYDIRSKSHINLTDKIGSSFVGNVFKLFISSPYGIAGWTPNDKEIIAYDQYDIWILKPDGSDSRRITKGREKKIEFRIYNFGTREHMIQNFSSWTAKSINLSDGLLLEAKGDDCKTGYFKWAERTGEIPVVYKASGISKLHSADRQRSFIYQDEQFDQSPKLIFKKGKNTVKFFQSNARLSSYFWGSSELFTYNNSKGQKLKGILYYPANYNPEKKYPMIVNVYERQSQNLYKFINPTLENEDAYNPATLTNEGYFVLCPDIVHEPRNEGPSAVDCTTAATKKIISRGLVFPDKIGLMGHSFGGYETAYIITKTNLFAAAVAGNAITDLNSYYFSVNWNSGRTTMNYFQSESFKMAGSPYDLPEAFELNSPIRYADKITTPLLSFTGKQDHHVDWYQSVEFYLALRRLNKKHIMLIYPEEGHAVNDRANQIDLSKRTYQWFAYFLKDEKSASWITDGIK